MIGVVNNKELGQPRRHHLQPGRRGRRGGARDRPHHRSAPASSCKRFAVGREDKCQLGGPVKIADMAGKAAKLGFEWLVQLVALLSVGIGILNLLPIPPLDGGHLLFYGVEAVIRRPVSERVMEMVYRVGLFRGAAASWDSCSGTICLGVEIMKKFGVRRDRWLRLRLPCRGYA